MEPFAISPCAKDRAHVRFSGFSPIGRESTRKRTNNENMTHYQITVAKYGEDGKARFHFRTDWMEDRNEFKSALASLQLLPKDVYKVSYYIRDTSTHFNEC